LTRPDPGRDNVTTSSFTQGVSATMKNVRVLFALALVAALVPASGALAARSSSGSTRIGLGLNLDRADFRMELSPENAIGGFLKFGVISGDAEGNLIGIGGYYLQRLKPAKPVDFHFLAGLAINTGSDSGIALMPDMLSMGMGADSVTDFMLFGGVGSEYFLPGTDQFSIEANVGLAIHFASAKAGDWDGSATMISIEDLTGAVVMLRYYFE